MKIAQFKTKDGEFEVAWLVFTPPTFRILHPDGVDKDNKQGRVFKDATGILPEKSGVVVECRLNVRGDRGIGFTACSPLDDFDLGVGLKRSLVNAIVDVSASNEGVTVDATNLWKALLADSVIGRDLRGESFYAFDPLHKELVRRFGSVGKSLQFKVELV